MRRRKAVICSLCEYKLTHNKHGVCDKCVDFWRHGKEQLAKLQEPGTPQPRQVNMTHLVLSSETAWRINRDKMSIADGWQINYRLVNKLLELAGAQPLPPGATRNQTPTVGMSSEEMATERITTYPTTFDYFLLTDHAAACLSAISINLNLLLADAYRSGYSAANGLLHRLASGNLTIEQLNEQELRHKGNNR